MKCVLKPNMELYMKYTRETKEMLHRSQVGMNVQYLAALFGHPVVILISACVLPP